MKHSGPLISLVPAWPIHTDLRHAVRLLGRSPVFTLTSIASLAIGIGAAATIFSLTDALLFKPSVGVRNSSEVVDIGRSDNGRATALRSE